MVGSGRDDVVDAALGVVIHDPFQRAVEQHGDQQNNNSLPGHATTWVTILGDAGGCSTSPCHFSGTEQVFYKREREIHIAVPGLAVTTLPSLTTASFNSWSRRQAPVDHAGIGRWPCGHPTVRR